MGFLDDALGFADGALRVAEGVVGTAPAQDSSAAPSLVPALPDPLAGPWRVLEAMIDEHGTTRVWIVTNGREQAECSSAALAEKVLDALR